MNEEQAYEALQNLLAIAEELTKAGHYSASEIRDEIRERCGE